MKLARLLLPAVLLIACATGASAATRFSEDFSSGNAQGWILGPEWQIGSAMGSPGGGGYNGDPSLDHSPTPDNQVAGAVLGGNITTSLHAPYTLVSPPVNLAGATGTVTLSFHRWLNADYAPYMTHTVQVYDGTNWVTLWSTGGFPGPADSAWTPQAFDVTAYKNAAFQVRFTHEVGSSSALSVSGWNVDDVIISDEACGDGDGDGFLPPACGGADCDDTDSTVYPGAPEMCDSKDNDCDGLVDEAAVDATVWYRDADADGFGNPDSTTVACVPPSGYVADASDCDDQNASVNPAAVEICDNLDNDCNGLVDDNPVGVVVYYRDFDDDGWGDLLDQLVLCPGSPPTGYVFNFGDCNDADAAIHPGAVEVLDGVDNNCDGQVDEGFENPVIRFVSDVPGDQGRAVRVRWRKDLRESANPNVTAYTIYRRIGPGQSALARMRRAGSELASLPPGEWDVLTTIPATLADSVYQTVVPTLCDSNAAGMCRATFVVRAFTSAPGVFYDSAPDSGYSIDNLAPGVPAGLQLQVVAGAKQLSWQPSGAPDFQYFRVYRGTTADFTPSSATLVHATPSTGWSDATAGAFTYKVTAVDANGNESAPATASTTVGVGESLPTALALGTLAPNPFRGSLALAIEVPQGAGAVTLGVYDLAGRRVRTLVNGAMAAGRHSLTWDGRTDAGGRVAPGVYLVRLMGAERSFTRRVTMMP